MNKDATINNLVAASYDYDCDYFTERGGGFYPHSVGDHQDPLSPEQVSYITENLPKLLEPFLLKSSSMEDFHFLHDEGYIEIEIPAIKEEGVDLFERFLLLAGISSEIVEEIQWELVDKDGKPVH